MALERVVRRLKEHILVFRIYRGIFLSFPLEGEILERRSSVVWRTYKCGSAQERKIILAAYTRIFVVLVRIIERVIRYGERLLEFIPDPRVFSEDDNVDVPPLDALPKRCKDFLSRVDGSLEVFGGKVQEARNHVTLMREEKFAHCGK